MTERPYPLTPPSPPRGEGEKSLLRGSALPAFDDAGIDAEQIEQPPAGMIDNVVDASRTVVEGGNDRRNYRADLSKHRHAAQVSDVQRRLANREHQPPFFLEYDIGGARQQRSSHPACNFAHGADRTWGNDHSHGR